MPDLVEPLNDFGRPSSHLTHSTGALLATEQEAGRLRIDPALVVLSAEGLPVGEYDRIAAAFGAVVLERRIASPFSRSSKLTDFEFVEVRLPRSISRYPASSTSATEAATIGRRRLGPRGSARIPTTTAAGSMGRELPLQ